MLNMQIARMRSGLGKVEGALHSHQRFGSYAKGLFKADRHLRGEPTPPIQKGADRLTGNAQMLGDSVVPAH